MNAIPLLLVGALFSGLFAFSLHGKTKRRSERTIDGKKVEILETDKGIRLITVTDAEGNLEAEFVYQNGNLQFQTPLMLDENSIKAFERLALKALSHEAF